MPLIPERLWAQMSDEEKTLVEDVALGFRQEPRITCPNCQHEIGVRVKVELGKTKDNGHVATSSPAPVEDEPLDPVLTHAMETGMLGAFQRAFEASTKTKFASDAKLHKAFRIFVDLAHPRAVPTFVLDRYKSIYTSGYIEFRQANGVIAVIVEHVWREFVPTAFLIGPALKNLSGNVKGRLAVDEHQVTDWVKGRFGYVPRASKDFKELLQKKSFGAFDGLVQ